MLSPSRHKLLSRVLKLQKSHWIAPVAPQSRLWLATTAIPQDAADNNSISQNTTTSNTHDNSSLSKIRTAILNSALQEVHHHGWTEDALAAGTASVKAQYNNKVSMSVVGMMTVDDLIAFCMDQWNTQLQQDLSQQKEQQQLTAAAEDHREQPASTMDNSIDPLEQGIKTRLEYLIPYLQSQRWHEGMALGIRGPSNALQTQKQLQEMINIIVANAAATNQQEQPNYNYKSSALGVPERMALGAVYVATELHLLTDTSLDYQDTWKFLSNRMEDWRQITCLASGSGGAAGSDTLFVATSVASSLVGGLVSLVMNPNQLPSKFGLPDAVWSSLFQSAQGTWGSSDGRKAGTHPGDYDVPKRS